VGELLAHVTLLGRFQLALGGEGVDLPLGVQHLIAVLALNAGLISRGRLAGTLWPDKPEARASANLRSSLWRLGRVSSELVCCPDGAVQLAPSVSVDVIAVEAQARRLLDPGASLEESDMAPGPLMSDLVPDWYDDWAAMERERLRQLRLHALEALCERLTAAGRFTDAVEVGLAAIAAEPLRESAHLVLMRVYEAEGNWCEVRRAYENLRHLLNMELAIEPSLRVEKFVHRVP
jgi:DNA-binding SARP family transcriptional activator